MSELYGIIVSVCVSLYVAFLCSLAWASDQSARLTMGVPKKKKNSHFATEAQATVRDWENHTTTSISQAGKFRVKFGIIFASIIYDFCIVLFMSFSLIMFSVSGSLLDTFPHFQMLEMQKEH